MEIMIRVERELDNESVGRETKSRRYCHNETKEQMFVPVVGVF